MSGSTWSEKGWFILWLGCGIVLCDTSAKPSSIDTSVIKATTSVFLKEMYVVSGRQLGSLVDTSDLASESDPLTQEGFTWMSFGAGSGMETACSGSSVVLVHDHRHYTKKHTYVTSKGVLTGTERGCEQSPWMKQISEKHRTKCTLQVLKNKSRPRLRIETAKGGRHREFELEKEKMSNPLAYMLGIPDTAAPPPKVRRDGVWLQFIQSPRVHVAGRDRFILGSLNQQCCLCI